MRVFNFVTIFFLGIGLASTFAESNGPPSYKVIVHPGNPATNVDRKFLESAFLKKTTQWGQDEVIFPVDLDTDSPTRRKFSAEILNRPVSAVKNYWQQMIFSGRDVPPPELESEEAVVKYVLKHPGAIGYVSDNADLSGVKVLGVK